MSTREEDEALAAAAKKKAERMIWFRMISGRSICIHLPMHIQKRIFQLGKRSPQRIQAAAYRHPCLADIATFLETRRQKMSGTHRQAIAVGMYRHWMVPRAMLMKKGVFKLIHEIKSTI
jgi:hypothetical protein